MTWLKLTITLSVFVVAVTSGDIARAAWTASATGSGQAQADSVPAGSQPTTSASNGDVTVSWDAVTFQDGTVVGGYVVRRFRASDGVESPVGAGCSGIVTTTSCTETGVPEGEWLYRIEPVHEQWHGPLGDGGSASVGNALAFVLRNGGSTDGKADHGDTIEITYRDPIDVGTFCSDWSNNATDHTISGAGVVTVKLVKTSTHDQVRVSTSAAACGGNFKFGHVDMDHSGNYVTGSVGSEAVFTGSGATASKIEWRASDRKLVITLGAETTNRSSRVASANTSTYHPHADNTMGGQPIAGPFYTAVVRQF